MEPSLKHRNLNVRVFDILKSGGGETALQINALGTVSRDVGRKFTDVLASNGATTWN